MPICARLPKAMILSGALMLEHLGEKESSQSVRKVVLKVLEEKTVLSADLGGAASTTEVADAIIAKL